MTTQPWPFPNDTVLDRYRHVAQAYREHLMLVDPELCARVDQRMAGFGQAWVLPVEDMYSAGDAITTSEAAVLVSVSEAVIRQWACMSHPTQPGPLLPRHRRRGREMTYVVEHVRAAAMIMDHYHANRASAAA